MILLVEDDVTIGRSLAQGLGAAGFAVRWLRGGAQVMEAVAGGEVRVVVLDVGLPDADGMELCQRLRAQGYGLPVLMLTARASLDDRLDGFAAGADDYLPKPFAFAELVARVKVLVKRAGERRPDPIVYGDLRIDGLMGEARWAGELLALEPKGLAVLCVLARARGAVVERGALIDAVWGEAEITDNALDVVVSGLRRRLAAGAPGVMVRTVRGAGLALDLIPLPV